MRQALIIKIMFHTLQLFTHVFTCDVAREEKLAESPIETGGQLVTK